MDRARNKDQTIQKEVKVGTRLFYYFYKIQEKVWRFLSKKSRINGLCLVFHHVTDTHLDELENCQCRITVFHKILSNLSEQGYKFVSVQTGMRMIKEHSTTKFVIVTFDDVPDNFYSNAYPILKEMKVPFTLFITSTFLYKDGYLTKEQIKQLSKDPLCTIGAHSRTHPQLRYSSTMEDEIINCKKEIESIIEKEIDYFAYPYGRVNTVNKRAISIAKKTYKNAFSTINCKLSDFTSKQTHNLPRVPLNNLYSE